MSESWDIFSSTPLAAEVSLLHVKHSYGLVALSLVVAFVSSCAAFAMLQTHRKASAPGYQRISLLCSSMVLGSGIWAMHFIGMLAMQSPTPVRYDVVLTALSILPGMLAALFALWVFQREMVSTTHIVLCGALVGVGIAAMHYSGIAAIQAQASIRFAMPVFALSLVLGVMFAILAFMAQRWLIRPAVAPRAMAWSLLPPTLMTAAIASMHYVSMHAMHWLLPDSAADGAPLRGAAGQDSTQLSLLIAGVAAVVFLIFALANALLRYRDLWQALAVRDARLKSMVDAAPDGVITIDEQGLIQDFNPQAQRIFGYALEDVMGRNISCLMPSPLAEEHDSHLKQHWGKPDKPITVNGREVLGKHKDGRLIPLQLSIGKAITPSGTIFVGYLQDISARKRTDAQLRIAASVFEHVQEGVAIVDANHNISDVNPAFLRLMEKTRDACIGQSLESMYEDADIPPDMSKLWQTVATQQYWQSECMFTRHNGTFWMQRLSISPVLNELKRPHHFIAVVSDVTERPGLEVMLSYADLHDSATGLANQTLFMDRLNNCMLAARKKNTHVGILLVQVTPAKAPAMQPNCKDCAGALRLIAHILEQQLRSTDTVARHADNQIAVLLPGFKEAADFHALFKRLVQAVGQTSASYTKYGISSIEVGSAATTLQVHTPAQLIAQAQATLAALPVPPSAKVPL